MYFYNGMPYLLWYSVNIDYLYSNDNGAGAVALLLDDATARHPSPDAPVVTIGDMPRAMVVRPHTVGIPLHRVCHYFPNGHVTVLPTTVYFTLRFPAAFRLESGSIAKSAQVERVGFSTITDIAFTDLITQGATFSWNKTYVPDLRPSNASAKNISCVVVPMRRIHALDALTLLLPLWSLDADKAARGSAKESSEKLGSPTQA
jgi:hypothetical protein